MLLALLVAVSSVMLGAALSFAPTSRGLLGYMRTFATLAAVAVVLTHLLPEALFALGPSSILLFLFGWFAPGLGHLIGQRSTHGRSAGAVLEAGYWGLMAHHVVDGVGLGTYTRLPAAAGGSHLDVIVALAAHTVPLIAVVALAYRLKFGTRAALLRSLGLALAGVLGIGLSASVRAATIEHYAPIVAAIAAGLLLHVVTHDLKEDPPRTPLARTLDLGVAVLGIAVSWLGLDRSGDPATWAFVGRFLGLAERLSLVILVGLAAVALSFRISDQTSKLGRAMGPARVLGSDGILLGIALFGFTSTALRMLVGCLVLLVLPLAPDDAPPPVRFFERVSAVLSRSGPWLLLGGVLGALLLAVPPSASIHRLAGSPIEFGVIALIANVTPVAMPAALLIAMGLSGLGLSAGGALLFTLLGPLLVGRPFGLRQRSALTVFCVAVAWLSNRFHVSGAPLDGALSASAPGAHMAIALGVLLALGVWWDGARVWLSTIVRTPAHEHEHVHGVHGPHD